MKIIKRIRKDIRSLLIKLLNNRVSSFAAFCIRFLYYALFTSEIKQIKGKWKTLPDSDVYYVYYTHASTPLVCYLPHMFTHNKPSFFWAKRNNMIQAEYIPEHVDYLSASRISFFCAQFALRRLIKAYRIRLKTNPNSMMYFMSLSNEALYLCHKHKIPDMNYKMIRYTTGYSSFPFMLHTVSDRNNYNDEVKFIKEYIKKEFAHWEPITVTHMKYKDLLTMTVVFPNMEYWCPNTELMPDFPKEMEDVKDTVKIKRVSATDIISSLPEEKLENLYKLINISREYYSGLFTDKSKPCMIIIGTPAIIADDFENNIKTATDIYSSEYTLFYKPHPHIVLPGSKSFAKTEKDVTAKNKIHMLDADLPVEFLVNLYPDVVIGGYYSTVFTGISSHRIKFIFMNKEQYIDNEPLSIYNLMNSYKHDVKKTSEKMLKYFKYFYDKGAYSGVTFIYKGKIQ